MDENLLQKIEDMYDEVMGMISDLTNLRPIIPQSTKITFETANGRQEIVIPLSLENLAAGRTDINF